MEARARRFGVQAASPERTKVWSEPPPKQPSLHQGKRIPVVYYLCQNRRLEHPHFIEVPLSSPDGLYLRDVINRLNVLRGKGIASMYSWSCKRSYKNGFVWHDLSEDDLVLPARGNEYILKGSELLDRSPPDQQHHGLSSPKNENLKHQQEGCSSYSSSPIVIKEAKVSPPAASPPISSLRENEQCCTPNSGSSGDCSPDIRERNAPSSGTSSPSLTEYKVYKPFVAHDVSTQTDDKGNKTLPPEIRIKRVSTDDEPSDPEFQEHYLNRTPRLKEWSEIVEASPPPTSSSALSGGTVDTLESLIRAEVSKRNSFRTLAEEEFYVPEGAKLKAPNLLMQLITCGAISVKGHRSIDLVPTYRPRFTQMCYPSQAFSSPMTPGDSDHISNTPRVTRLRPKAEYFSGSLLETKIQEGAGRRVPTLERSSSVSEDRTYRIPGLKRDTESSAHSANSKCLPQMIKVTPYKQSNNETFSSPISARRNSSAGSESSRSTPPSSWKVGSRRMSESFPSKGSSMRLESFKEEKEKVFKIEERLASGAKVIIQSTSLSNDDNSD
ncbi:protein SOSEKI 3-like [Typha latifolia]|uniref:protein SOSEKI 3-like n=1 Tax=Typha latifolia TaxID=4733 RepID=UPI003C2E65B3